MIEKKLKIVSAKLMSMGLVKESDEVKYIIKKLSQEATGRNSALKIMLQRILRRFNYTVGTENDPENEGRYINVPLNVRSNSWGNLNHAWKTFANHISLPQIAENWEEVAPSIGTGYSGTRAGMFDLLQDFESGGRAAVGADLGTLGELAEPEQAERSRQGDELRDTYIPGWRGEEREQRGQEFEEQRSELESDARRADRERQEEEIEQQEALPEDPGGQVASVSPQAGASTRVGGIGTWIKQSDDCWILNISSPLNLNDGHRGPRRRVESLRRCSDNSLMFRAPRRRERWNSAAENMYKEHIPSYRELEDSVR